MNDATLVAYRRNHRFTAARLAEFFSRDYFCVVAIRLLLAEDNPHMAGALEAILAEQSDIRIVGIAQDGEQAIRLADELSPDVVVVDRAMPGLDGIAAMRQIKRRHACLPVVVLTATTDAQIAQEALAAGASGFVAKDVAFEELAVAIRTVFAKKVYLSPRLGGRLIT